MSIPRNHHYLPIFYQKRWAVDGLLWRFVRPRGPDGPLHSAEVAAGAAGYMRDLYRLNGAPEAADAQSVELEFFREIDDRAAKAFNLIETGKIGGNAHLAGLTQFMVSLLHRSPSRLNFTREEMRRRIEPDLPEVLELQHLLHNTSIEMLANLSSTSGMVETLSDFHTFLVTLDDDAQDLITSDRPLMLSETLMDESAFALIPFSPRQFLLRTRCRNLVEWFESADPRSLALAINFTVARQARHLVIASKRTVRGFVDDFFLRKLSDPEGDLTGELVRWTVEEIKRNYRSRVTYAFPKLL